MLSALKSAKDHEAGAEQAQAVLGEAPGVSDVEAEIDAMRRGDVHTHGEGECRGVQREADGHDAARDGRQDLRHRDRAIIQRSRQKRRWDEGKGADDEVQREHAHGGADRRFVEEPSGGRRGQHGDATRRGPQGGFHPEAGGERVIVERLRLHRGRVQSQIVKLGQEVDEDQREAHDAVIVGAEVPRQHDARGELKRHRHHAGEGTVADVAEQAMERRHLARRPIR
jgi:hypothetical protein